MPRNTKMHEYHKVRCAACGRRTTIKLPNEGKLSISENTRDFNERDEFICSKKACRASQR